MFNIRQLRILLDSHCCLVTKLCPALCDPIDCSLGFPWWLSSKEFMGNTAARGDTGSTPGLGRSPGGGHGKPLQYSCLENLMNRGAWRATVHGVPKSWTQLKRLSRLALYIRYRVFKHLGCSTERGMVFASLTCLYFLDKNNSKQPFK